jgi:mannose-1-phosphate guanylyltransferase
MLAYILAGGTGTRFWPMSREDRPKQLVRLWGDETMIETTAHRLAPAAQDKGVFVVCGPDLVDPIAKTFGDWPDEQFVIEPMARDTAPAIALAAIQTLEHAGDVPFGVFPADHYIGDDEAFRRCLAAAESAAQDGHIVTIGIEPSRPETGYGYIHFDDAHAEGDDTSTHDVEAFVEKPDRKRAKRYLSSGDYLWNAGMFVMTPSTLLDEMERQLPAMYESFLRIRDSWGTDAQTDVLEEEFSEMEGISIDYGIMENARDVVCVPAEFTWSDVGHWAALDEVRETDEDDNVVEADAILENVENSVIFSEHSDRLIAGIDLDDMVVVDTDNAVLVLPKGSAQKVREIVHRLRDAGRDDVL